MVLVSYFLLTYFISTQALNDMETAISQLNSIFLRKTCAENVIYATYENFIGNATVKNIIGQPLFQTYYDTCTSYEAQY
jgi:hypothetical protein